MGAWIEIKSLTHKVKGRQSHPTWVRGLKLLGGAGLQPRRGVAPHVGAWIEITACNRHGRTSPVAPHVGAWIEMSGLSLRLTAAARRTPRGCVD